MSTTDDADNIVVTLLPIQQDAVQHPSEAARDELEKIVGGFAALCVKEGRLRKITLTISGYDADPRELYEVPEVCDWAMVTFRFLPSLWFFLDTNSQQRFVGWLCGPISRKDVESREFRERFQETWQKCAIDSTLASSDFLERAGASCELVSEFYSQDMNRQAAELARQKKWWQFWKKDAKGLVADAMHFEKDFLQPRKRADSGSGQTDIRGSVDKDKTQPVSGQFRCTAGHTQLTFGCDACRNLAYLKEER